MPNLSIGISGLSAAQRGIDVVGNNMANAATEGYHRQVINFKPASAIPQGGFVYGQGVEVNSVSRVVDQLLNNEIMRQNSAFSQYQRELMGLQTVETSFAELNANSLSQSMDEFFQAIEEFSKQPQSQIYENKVTSTAVALCDQLNSMGDLIESLQESILVESKAVISELNELTKSYAYTNSRIIAIEAGGVQANDLRNERDQMLTKISELVDIRSIEREDGSVDITIASTGTVLVVGASSNPDFNIEKLTAGAIGLEEEGLVECHTEISGGNLGGLFKLNNDYLAEIKNELDTLTSAIVNNVNQVHFQGVGADGSFQQLNGITVSSDPLSQWSDITVPGKIYVRITNTANSQINRYSIDVDGTDTIETIAAKLNGASVPNLNASFDGSILSLQSDEGYKFDFLAGVTSDPTTSNMFGTSRPVMSGIYQGQTNKTYTCTISGSGRVGVEENLQLEIKNELDEVIKTIDIGQGYVADSPIQIEDGIEISLTNGVVISGNDFTIEALATSDETGVLVAAGINSFFNGDTAASVNVSKEIINGVRRMAASAGPEMVDNENLLRLKAVYDENYDSLEGRNIRQYHQNIATDLGQKIQIIEMKKESLGAVLKNLNEKHEEISGVDINTEATRLMMFEQMFQAMSRYLSVCQDVMDEVARIL